MTVFFEALDLATGNGIEDFTTEENAIEALRAARRDHGPDAISDIALLRYEDGHPTLVAMEDAFVRQLPASTADTRIRIG